MKQYLGDAYGYPTYVEIKKATDISVAMKGGEPPMAKDKSPKKEVKKAPKAPKGKKGKK